SDHAFSVQPRAVVPERLRTVPPTARTPGTVAGESACPYAESPVEATVVTPGCVKNLAFRLAPSCSEDPQELLMTVAPAATAVCWARSSPRPELLASTRISRQVGQAAETICRSMAVSSPHPVSGRG